MIKINKEYMIKKISSIYQKIFKVVPYENKLSFDLLKIANTYYNAIKKLEITNPINFDNLFTDITESFWKNLQFIINSYITCNNDTYIEYGYKIEEIILNESW